MDTLEILETLKPALSIQDYETIKSYIDKKQYKQAETLARTKQRAAYKTIKAEGKDPWENPYYRCFYQLIANLACTVVKEQLIYGDDDDDNDYEY